MYNSGPRISIFQATLTEKSPDKYTYQVYCSNQCCITYNYPSAKTCLTPLRNAIWLCWMGTSKINSTNSKVWVPLLRLVVKYIYLPVGLICTSAERVTDTLKVHRTTMTSSSVPAFRRLQLNCNILLKPTGHVTHQQFNIQQLYVLPTLYFCVFYLSENKQRLVPLTA